MMMVSFEINNQIVLIQKDYVFQISYKINSEFSGNVTRRIEEIVHSFSPKIQELKRYNMSWKTAMLLIAILGILGESIFIRQI